MRKVQGIVAVVVAMVLAGCGVPRASVDVARAQAAGLAAVNAQDSATVRAALREQAGRWETMGKLLRQRELGGVAFVEPRVVELVDRTAAVARRQAALMEQGADDPAKNAALLEEFRALWGQMAAYLGR